jgi:hypothetical protein
MTDGVPSEFVTPVAGRCLNCGAELHGAFCAACGQRSVPANPTVSELAGDAWHELSGYDGRIAATFRNLLRPGRLTLDYLRGHRARYLSPIRLYLIASVVYFVTAAAAPTDPRQSPAEVRGPGGLRIGLWDDSRNATLTEEERAEIKAEIAATSWPLRPLLEAVDRDPVAFRARLFTIMPRVFFGMLPVFAGIVWLFYRRRFPASLVFAVHLHAFAFLIFSVSEAAKQTRSVALGAAIGLTAAIVFVIYTLLSIRAVFGGRWPMTLVKAAGIGVVYLLTSVPAFLIVLVWASL